VDTPDILIVSNWIVSLPLEGLPDVPVFNSIQTAGTNLVFQGNNGWPGQNYYLLTSTNLTLPLNQWKTISTNPFTPAGGFNFTNPMLPGTASLFYLLQLQ